MKSPLVLAVSVLVILAAGIGVLLLERKSAASAQETRARLEMLSREIPELRAELAALKAGDISAEQRGAILKLIADDRAEQKRLQGEDEHKRFTELSRACADRAARKYGLTDDQRNGVFDVLMMGREKLNAMDVQPIDFRNAGDVDAMAEAANKAFQALKTWRLDELTKRLGPDLARRVNEDELGMLGDAGRLEASRQGR